MKLIVLRRTQDFGDGRWVAQWNTAVFHTGNFLGQN
jgi:hypothetical protein